MPPSKVPAPTRAADTQAYEFRRLEAVLLGLLFGLLIVSMGQTLHGVRTGLHVENPSAVAAPVAVPAPAPDH